MIYNLQSNLIYSFSSKTIDDWVYFAYFIYEKDLVYNYQRVKLSP